MGDAKSISVARLAEIHKIVGKQMEKAMENPQKGTMISVIEQSTNEPNVIAATKDISEYYRVWLQYAKVHLDATPDELVVDGKQILKTHFKGKVVCDSGAKGFYFICEGMAKAAMGEIVPDHPSLDANQDSSKTFFSSVEGEDGISMTSAFEEVQGMSLSELKYRFCTELILKVQNKDTVTSETIKIAISKFGDSTIALVSGSFAKIHIHTNEPQKVFDACGKIGGKGALEIMKEKVEDMKTQVWASTYDCNHGCNHDHHNTFIVSHSSSNIPESLRQRFGMGLISSMINIENFGEYAVKQGISSEEFLSLLRYEDPVARTSAPAMHLLDQTIKRGLNTKKDVLIMPLSLNLSEGTRNNLKKTISQLSKEDQERVVVFDTKQACGPLFYMALEAQKMALQGLSAKEIKKKLEQYQAEGDKRYISMFSIPTLKYLHRGGRVSGGKLAAGKLLNIKLIMHMDPEGMLKPYGKVLGPGSWSRAKKKMLSIMFKKVPKNAKVSFDLLHNGRPDQIVHLYEEKLRKHFPNIQRITTSILSPDISCHCGPDLAGLCCWIHD